MKKLLIWGAGDQGTVTLDCALAMNRYSKIDFLTLKEKNSRDIPGYVLYREEEENLQQLMLAYDEVIVATGSNALREAKTALLLELGTALATVIHPTAVISRFAKVSEGCTVLANALIHTNARVGTGCIVNTGAIVEHDCILEEYVNLGFWGPAPIPGRGMMPLHPPLFSGGRCFGRSAGGSGGYPSASR